MGKPVLLVTRRLPEAIEARASRDYEARLSVDDAPVGAEAIVAGAAGAAAVLCCPAEKLDAAVIGALPESVKVIGTFSVGFDHVDVGAAAARGISVVNTPDVLSVATAECAMLLILAAARRAGGGGAAGSEWSLGGLGADAADGDAGFGAAVGDFWDGTDWAGVGADGGRVRDGGALPGSAAVAGGVGGGGRRIIRRTMGFWRFATCCRCMRRGGQGRGIGWMRGGLQSCRGGRWWRMRRVGR